MKHLLTLSYFARLGFMMTNMIYSLTRGRGKEGTHKGQGVPSPTSGAGWPGRPHGHCRLETALLLLHLGHPTLERLVACAFQAQLVGFTISIYGITQQVLIFCCAMINCYFHSRRLMLLGIPWRGLPLEHCFSSSFWKDSGDECAFLLFPVVKILKSQYIPFFLNSSCNDLLINCSEVLFFNGRQENCITKIKFLLETFQWPTINCTRVWFFIRWQSLASSKQNEGQKAWAQFHALSTWKFARSCNVVRFFIGLQSLASYKREKGWKTWNFIILHPL